MRSVHDQARDQCMISHVISEWSSTWSVRAQSRDHGLLSCIIPLCSPASQLPAELQISACHLLDNCQLCCINPAYSAAWLLPAEQHDSSQLSSMIIACWLFDSCLLRSLFIASRATWSVYDSKHDQRMISHMISTIKSRDHYMIVMWSVHAQSRYQCMISHVISAWSVTWSLNNSTHDQCMIANRSVNDSHLIIAW